MSTSLRQRLSELATSFASDVLGAIRGASLEELVGQSSRSHGKGGRPASRAAAGGAAERGVRRRGGRLPRRSATDIAQVVEQIVGLLRQNPKGLRAEQIREQLELQAKELPRPLKEALDSGRLAKSGQKRATTYVVKGGGASSARGGGGRRGKRSARGGGKGKAKGARRPRAAEKKPPVASVEASQA